jgi:hypothetical protein
MLTCRAITLTETIISIKCGKELFKDAVITNILIWLVVQMFASFFSIYSCALVAQRWNKWKVR